MQVQQKSFTNLRVLLVLSDRSVIYHFINYFISLIIDYFTLRHSIKIEVNDWFFATLVVNK
jgi:hypothetical protein